MFKSSEEAKEANARGNARQVELREEMKTAIETNSKAMLAGLFRAATPDEVGLAEAICSLLWKAAQRRGSGRSDLEHLREAGILMKDWRALPRGPAPTTEPSE
jgi:hypothetical protein